MNLAKPNPFGSSSTQTAAPFAQSAGLFGTSSGTGLFGQTQTTALAGDTFGNAKIQNNHPHNGGLFDSLGASGPTNSTAHGQQDQKQRDGIFNGTAREMSQPYQIQSSSVFMPAVSRSQLGHSLGSEAVSRQKPVTDQIGLAFAKWNPQSNQSAFRTYVYNSVPIENAPFYGPGPQDDEASWEQALANKPSTGSIPVAVRGFEELAGRMQQQYLNLSILRGRLHEIDNGLTALLQKHATSLSLRTVEARRKHLLLSRQCLSLAAKTQTLRNRGYAMDGAEDELKNKFISLERQINDPALTSRAENLWARMYNIREQGQALQRDFEIAKSSMQPGQDGTVNSEIAARATKILEDYDTQLIHLVKEVEHIQREWNLWNDKVYSER